MNVEAGLQLSDLQGILRRRAKLVLGVALLVSLAAYWLAMALPNEYESYATVLVEPQSVDPDLVEAGVPESDLNRRLFLMAAQILSRPRLSRMVDEFGLYKEESNYLVRDEVIDLMRGQIRVEPVSPELEQKQAAPRGGFEIDQFKIFYRSASPVLARNVAQELANDFIEEHISTRVKVSQKSVEFIEAELGRLSEAIEKVEAKVAEIKDANPGRLPEDMAATQRRLERLTMELAAVRRDASIAQSDEGFYRSQSATARSLVGSTPAEANTPAHRAQILELALSDYKARGFTDKHPDVIKAQEEIRVLRAQLEVKEEAGSSGSYGELSAAAEAERARLRKEQAEQEVARLEQAAAQFQQLLNETPRVAERLDALEREYRHLFESYQDFSNRRLEAGLQANLERRQLGEQFRVLEAAFLAPEPAAPNRIVIIVIGVIFGLALGGGLGIVVEAADASIHEARQLQASLNIPVLASIPRIWFESDRLKQRRARLRSAAATAALVVFALAGGAANYWWVNGARPGPSLAGAEETAEPVADGGAAGEPAQRRRARRAPDVLRTLRPAPHALRDDARPGVSLPGRDASGGARHARLRRAVGQGLRDAHRRGRHRQDHAAARPARPARRQHGLRLPLQPQARAPRLLPDPVRRVRHRGDVPDQGRVPAGAEPLPDRAAGPQREDAADHRRGPDAVVRHARGGAAALEPRDPDARSCCRSCWWGSPS